MWKVKCSLLCSQNRLKHLNAAPLITQIFDYKMILPYILHFTSAVIHESLGVNISACFPLPEYSTRFANLNFLYFITITLILRRSRTGTVWFYTSTSNKSAARPKLYTKSLTRDLKRMYNRLTLVRISIKL